MNTLRNILAVAVLLPVLASAQVRYATRSGEISFFSKTAMENIDAVTHKATSVFDPASGAMEFAVLMKSFEFEKALMQEHFNENYVESDKYPKATFKGKVTGLAADAMSKPGTYDVTVEGDMTMHGVTKHIKEKGRIIIDAAGAVKAESDITIKLADYAIEIPSVVKDTISEDIQVKVRIDYQKM